MITLLALFVRLWFDIAQVRAVVQDEHKMWPNLWKALGISWRNVATLFRVYLCISGVAWVTLAVGLVLWANLPPTATPVTFLLLEFIILMQLRPGSGSGPALSPGTVAMRRAVPADAVDYTTPAPVELDRNATEQYCQKQSPAPESEATPTKTPEELAAATMSDEASPADEKRGASRAPLHTSACIPA